MKKPKRRDASVEPLSGQSVRLLDEWRIAALKPLSHLQLMPEESTAEPKNPRWTLTEDGVTVAQWREAAMPGFAPWLKLKLAQLHGALHIAQPELDATPNKTQGGINSGKKRAGSTSVASLIRDEVARLAAKGWDPFQNVRKIAAKVAADARNKRKSCSVRYVHDVLNGRTKSRN